MYRALQFQKRSQLFVGADNEMLSLAVGVNDPNCAPVIAERGNPAHAKSGFAEIVSDDFPMLHAASCY